MSIPLIIETQSEVKRLLVAGSELAVGDFRLKKLLPQMKKAGESVPVFARVAEVMEKVIELGSDKAAEKLLELANLVNAILYTQGQTGIEGTLTDIDSTELGFPTTISYRRLKPVLEALTSKGSGRLEIIREAYIEGVFKDLRLAYPLIQGLDDSYPDIADLAQGILQELGTSIVPVLKENFDFNGGKGHARKIELIAELAGKSEKEFILKAVEEGAGEVKVSAVKALKAFPECEPILLELSKDRKKDVREASLLSLSHLGSETAVKKLFDIFNSKERNLAAYPVKVSGSRSIALMLLEEAEKTFEVIIKSKKEFSLFARKVDPPSEEAVVGFATILDCMEGKKEPEIFEFLKKCLDQTRHLQQFKLNIKNRYATENTLARMVANNLIAFGTNEAYTLLDSIQGKYDNSLLAYSFEAAVRSRNSQYVFDHYSRYVKSSRKTYEGQEILDVMDSYIDFALPFRLTEFYGENKLSLHLTDIKKEDISWDPRWAKVLIAIDEVSLVCKLASKNDTRSIDYLLKKLEPSKGFNEPYLKDILRGLMQAQYPNIMGVVREVLEYNFKKAGHYLGYYFSDLARVLRLLPPESAKELEEFASAYDNETAGKLFEVAHYIRNNKK